MTDRVGQQLGNYRLTHLLGRGGFADVYLGEHVRLNTKAAIKVLHTQLAEDDRDSFLAEAQTIANLEHPHIVRVLDFDVEEGIPFLVMSYAPHGTLRKQHPKGTQLPLLTVISYVKQLTDALQYAHDEKLIHRDVKPENMLLGRRNEVLLSDFGIALLAQSSRYQSTEDVIGTIAYMSPEQIQGKPRPASDQYSLGIVVYEWLSGDRPFHGSYSELCAQHTFATPTPLREKVPTILQEVEQVVLTALAKEPKQRFASIQAFATALEQASQAAQLRSSILSQALTTLDQPRRSVQEASPVAPVSQQTIASPPSKGVQTPPVPSDQSRQPVSISRMQSRFEPVHQGISRRAIILGLGTAGLAMAGGGLTWLVSSLTSTTRAPRQVIHLPTPISTTTAAATGTTSTGTPAATPTTGTQGNLLPTPSSFVAGKLAVVGVSMKYPADWIQDQPQTSPNFTAITIHPQQQLGLAFGIQRLSASGSAQIKSVNDLNQSILQPSPNDTNQHNFKQIQPVNPTPTIGGVQWTEQAATFTSNQGILFHNVSISVLHNNLYYNINYFTPDVVYVEAMQKYYSQMLSSFQFLS